MGDVLNCTRLLSHATDLVPLPAEPAEIPRIPLVSISHRIGSLLDVFGEKTSEQHVINALIRSIQHWRKQGMHVELCDFASYPKLDAFPSRYVIFVELIHDNNDLNGTKSGHEKFLLLQDVADTDMERELCEVNHKYKEFRSSNRLGPVICFLVQSGTFSNFLCEKLMTDRVSPIQVKPHRLLKSENHVQYFYDRRIHNTYS